MPLLALIAIAIVCGFVWHRYVPKFAIATLGAAVTTVVLYQAVGFFVEGAPNASAELWLRAVLITGTIALITSALVGWPMHRRRKEAGKGAL